MISRLLASVLTDNQKVALVLSKTVSSLLSLIASSIIVYKIYLRTTKPKSTVVSSSLRSSKNDGGMTTYYRMLLSISILDVVHSISSGFSTLLVPSYTNGTFAHGTTGTCSVQGALQQLTPSIVIYMAMLNTYFMLKIRYNVSDATITNRFEFWFHAIPIAHFLSTAITGLSMRIYGPIILTELGCWLDSYCVYTNTCTRSSPIFYNYIDYYAWSFAYIWLFICVFIVSINAILIYTAIRAQEKRNEKYLGAKLQNAGAGSGSGINRSIVSSCSLEEFDIGEDVDESTPDMSAVAHLKDHTTGNDLLLKNDIEAKPKATFNISNTETQASSPEQAPESPLNSQDMKEVGTTGNVNSSLTSRQSQGVRSTQKIKQSRIAAVQSMLYVASALFTAVWIFMPWVGRKLEVKTQWRFFFAFMVNIVGPSQGLFNLFVFVRLHYLRLRETNKEWSRWHCVKQCLFSAD